MIIRKLKEFSLDNKYTKYYILIVNKARDRVVTHKAKFRKKELAISLVGEVESHHIIPRCIAPDLIKDNNNLVYLSLREHFICHLLLVKMMSSSYHKIKMLYAMNRLATKHKYTSRVYVNLKVAFTEANRQKSIKELKDPERRASFVKAGLEAGKVKRDKDTKKWVSKSMGSEEGKAKAKASHQSDEHREFCRQRELSKTKEQRATLAHTGQQALVSKCGGQEGYKKMLRDRMVGRKKYINPITKQVKTVREAIQGWMLVTEYNTQQKLMMG